MFAEKHKHACTNHMCVTFGRIEDQQSYILFKERPFDLKDIQYVKSYIRMKQSFETGSRVDVSRNNQFVIDDNPFAVMETCN